MATGSNTFGGTIKLEGEAEYRKAISNINSSLKVMGSEMGKVTAEFGKENTSTEALSQKNEILNKKIQTQQEKVNLLKEALDKASTGQNTNQKSIDNWKISLNKAETDLISMKKDLENNNVTMEQNSNQATKNSKSMQDFGNSEKDAGTQGLKLGDIIKANLISDVIKSGITALASGIGKVTENMKNAVTSGSEYADNILTISTQTGMSAESLQKYSAVAELVDVDLDTVTGSMSKMTKGLDSNKSTYDKLGVSIKDANGNLRSQDDIFMDTIDALGKVDNETERNQISMSLFGKSAEQLNPLIAQGSAGLEELGLKAEKMGSVLSGDALKSLGDMDDQFQIFKSTTKATGNILASAFAPAITLVTEGANNAIGSFNGLINAIAKGDNKGIDKWMISLKSDISGMVNVIAQQAPKIIELISNLIVTIGEVITENLPTIITAGTQVLTSLIQGIVSTLPEILPAIVQAIMTIVQGIIDNLPTILQAGITVIVSLIQGIASALPQLIPAIVNAVLLMVETIIDNIDVIIDAGIQIIFGLIDGIINALPQLIDKIPEIIDKLVNAIVDNLPKIIEAGIILIIKLAEGLIKAIPQLISKIPQIIGSLVNGILNLQGKLWDAGGNLLSQLGEGIKNGIGSMLEIGKNIVEGLWNGISDHIAWISDKIRGFGQSILNKIKDIFGIHSPSKVMKEQVGKYLAQGIGEGFSDEMDSVTKNMQNSIPSNFNMGVNGKLENNIVSSTKATSSMQNGQTEILKNAFKDAMKEFMGVVQIDDEKMGKFIIKKVEGVVYE